MIKAQQLEVQFNEKTKRIAEKLEAEIDICLDKNYRGHGKKIIFSSSSVYEQYIIDFVGAKYRENGWTVTSHSDQRDGDYIEFIPSPYYDWHGH